MKRFYLLSMFICFINITNAQLTLDQYGKAKIGTDGTTTQGGDVSLDVRGYTDAIFANIAPPGTVADNGPQCVAIRGNAQHTSNEYSVGVWGSAGASTTSGACYGVFGEAHGGIYGYNYGIYGRINSGVPGAAVYGGVTSSMCGPILSNSYAGLFSGNVIVTGNIYGTLVSGTPSYSPGNSRFQVTNDLSSQRVSDLISNVKATSGYITMPDMESKGDNDNRVHYALYADDVEAVFPDLVYTDSDGSKSVNYVELVPILVQAVNELRSELATVRGVDISQTRSIDNVIDNVDAIVLPSLGENAPNPCSGSTVITVTIPESVIFAKLSVYDLTGKKVLNQGVSVRGTNKITLDASNLPDGIYLYSLITDGYVVQTRRMIIER